jgi:uncharacterized protein YerC
VSRLEDVLVVIRSPTEAAEFLKALCTPQEARRLQNRWQSFEMRLSGATQRQICRALGISMDVANRCAQVTKSDSKIIRALARRLVRQPRM